MYILNLTRLSLLSMCIWVACTSKNEKELVTPAVLPPSVQNPCKDSANISYQQVVIPILRNNCYRCHDQQGSSSPKFDTYASLKIIVNNGDFYGAVSHAKGYLPMPSATQKLSDCNLRSLKAWIDEGAKDN